MIIMRGNYLVKEESRIEEIFKISIKEIHGDKIDISVCCTKVDQEWSYSDGPEEIASAWLLYSLAQVGKKVFVNGVHCCSGSPLGGFWLEKGAISLLEEKIKDYYKYDIESYYFDRKDPYKVVDTYAHFLGSTHAPDKIVGKYSLISVGRIHTIYQGIRPIISINDISNGIYLNKWNIIHVPQGFPHEENDIVQREFFDTWQYRMMNYN